MLYGKKAIVLGARGGLGVEVVNALTKEGRINTVMELDLPDFDVTDSACRAEFRLKHEHDTWDVIINCAGINRPRSIKDMYTNHIIDHMDANILGFVEFIRGSLPKISKDGVICNVVSTAATWPMTNSLAYCMSKAAQLQATKVMARELKRTHGVTVFSVSPHVLNTPMTTRVYEDLPKPLSPGAQEELERLIQPEALAELIAFIVTRPTQYRNLNGCDIPYGAPRQ